LQNIGCKWNKNVRIFQVTAWICYWHTVHYQAFGYTTSYTTAFCQQHQRKGLLVFDKLQQFDKKRWE